MQLKSDNCSLLITARQMGTDGPRIVVSVGLLYDADWNIASAPEAQKWLAERFSKQAFDHGLMKSRGSFAVHGNAYALSAEQQQGMAVRVSLGSVSKTLHVFPPRQWCKGLTGWSIEPTGRLDVLPLSWQQAYGGQDYPDNPEGMGYIADPNRAEGLQLPSIEDPYSPLRQPGEHRQPVSFLPLPPQSSERVKFLGTCDAQWSRQRAPFLPLDSDPRWYDEVAQDQCAESYWTGTECWTIAGMHPERLELTGRLPGFRPRLFVQRRALPPPPGASSDMPGIEPIEEAALQLDTVWLFPDVERVLLIYRVELGVLDLDGEDLAALAVGLERQGDAHRSREQWIAELWPQASTAPAEAPPAMPLPNVDSAAFMAKMQSAMDAQYAKLAAAQQAGLALLKQTASLSKQPISPPAFKPVATPNLAELAKLPSRPKTVFDPQALKVEIEAAIAKAKAAGEELFAAGAKTSGQDPQRMLARTKRLQQELLAQPSSVTDPYALLIDQLNVPASQKAEYKQRIQAGMAKASATEAEVNGKVAAMRQTIAANKKLKRPALPDLPMPKARIAWTRERLEASHKAGEKLDGEQFIDLDLSGIDLSAGVLQNCHFEHCQLKNAKLTGALLSGGRFSGCDFTLADLQQAVLDGSTFKACTFSQGKLGKASLEAVHAEQCPFDGADLTQARAPRAQFVDCRFAGAQLLQADFTAARWQQCDLSATDLQEARLGKAQLHACTLDEANFAQASLPASSWSAVSGRAVNLRAADLSNWRLDQGCRLPAAHLEQANLSRASLQHADLQEAQLSAATLTRALLSHCDLSGSNGSRAQATQADFSGSNLSRSNWQAANFFEARLRKVNLQQADLRGSNLHGLNSEGAHGQAVRLEGALMSRCRLQEDLAHG